MIKTDQIDYKDVDTVCRGFIAYEDDLPMPRPAVMLVHDWSGRGEEICNKARQLAAMGYVGFAVDMYGQARLGHTKEEKQALMSVLANDRKKLLSRIKAAFDRLLTLPQINKEKIAAMGYCFGGLCVLDLARSGVALKAVVSFHGLLAAPEGAICQTIPAKILALHGYDDPLVKPDQLLQFANEMTERKADWQIHVYGLTAHSFTNPQANDTEMGLHYNERADHRSWQSAKGFLSEVFQDNF